MKKIYFYILYLVIFFLFINICSLLTIYVVTKQNYFNKTDYTLFKKRFSKSDKKSLYPHPFFGFNFTTHKPAKDKITLDEQLYNNLPDQLLENDIKILILGGSVAEDFSYNDTSQEFEKNDFTIHPQNIFQNLLNKKFKTNRFKIYNAAIGGGKQPQQLFKLYYLYLVDEKFDVVINLDGFNEIALSFSENIDIGNSFLYPRNYSRIISTFNSDLNCIQKSNQYTASYNFIPLVELYKLSVIRNCHIKTEGDPNEKRNQFSKMSNFKQLKSEKYFEYIEDLWIRSSEQIESFSNEKKFQYIHVIQPSHYLKNSKIYSKKELELLNYPKYGNPISKHYGKLNFENLNIKNKLDLRYIFKENNKTLYRDYCCHLNNYGMKLIADKIIKEFYDLFESELKSN